MIEKTEKHPMIIFTKNSPYYLVDVPQLVNYKGKSFPLDPVTAICRCGKSKNMPYCDGSHNRVRFNGVKSQFREQDTHKRYHGEQIHVIYNRGVCNHNGACFNGLPGVFRLGLRPWIKPDEGTVKEIIELISHCPTGAFSYEIDGELHQSYDRPPMMRIQYGGAI